MKRNIKTRRLAYESLEDRQMLSINWVVNTSADAATWSEEDTTLSLREAVSRADDGDLITFSSTLSGKSLGLKFGELLVQSQIEIDASNLASAAGTNKITLNALSSSRHFNVSENASLTLKNINLQNGFSNSDGGSIYTYSTLSLIDCNISSSATTAYGGAIFSYKGKVSIVNGSISYCTGSDHGGAIYTYFGTLNIDGCTISNNLAGIGGGLDCNETNTVITRSKIINNKINNEYLFAGGIFALYGTMTITDSVISGNTSYNWGGGMYIYAATVSITNSAIVDNSTAHTGGGIQNFGYLTLTQCTIAGNTTTETDSAGAGIYNEYDNGHGMYAKAYNCIIAENLSGGFKSDYDGVGYGYGYSTVSSDFSEWTSAEDCSTYSSSSPLFTDSSAGDYTLPSDSQVLGKGNSQYAVYPDGTPILYDLLGNDRYRSGDLDPGAYQYTPQTFLDPPANVKVASGGANRLTLSWDKVEHSSGYVAAWSEDNASWTFGTTNDTSLLVTGLTYNKTYYLKVMTSGDDDPYHSSEYSTVVSRFVCPSDIDGDGFVGPGDNAIMSKAWFTLEGGTDWDQRCDIDGDRFVGPGDRSYISINWFKMPGYDNIINPPALAEVVIPAVFESPDLDNLFPDFL